MNVVNIPRSKHQFSGRVTSKTASAEYLEQAGLPGALPPLLAGGTAECRVQDQQGLSWTDPPIASQFDKNQEDMGAEGLSLASVANGRVQEAMIVAFWAPRTAASEIEPGGTWERTVHRIL